MSNFEPEEATSSGLLQAREDLKLDMGWEIADQTFCFPSDELARILSPKKPKDGADISELLQIKDYDCDVDLDHDFQNALNHVVEKPKLYTSPSDSAEESHYEPLANYLTDYVKSCNEALDGQKTSSKEKEGPKRWYHDLGFVPARPMADKVEGAASLEPDIVGGNGISKFRDDSFYWKAPADKPTHQLMIPVEVKENWQEIVSQAATHARAIFSERPMRVFALVLAFNNKEKKFTFLIFHRGGLAASEPSDITTEDGSKEVARLFLTLALWRTAADAGIVACSDDTTYLLPKDPEGKDHVRATVDSVLFKSASIRGRMTHVFLLRLLGPDSPDQEKNPVEQSVGSSRRTTRARGKAKEQGTEIEGQVIWECADR